MIHQFCELGRYFSKREGVADALDQFAQDPAAKFGDTVLLLIFGPTGFECAQPESYDSAQRKRFLYRTGPPNGWDPTPTSGMPLPKPGKTEEDFRADLHTRLVRLGSSVRDALNVSSNISNEEKRQLKRLSACLPPKKTKRESRRAKTRERIIIDLLDKHPDPKQRAFLSIAWRTADGTLKYVGDFDSFRQQLMRCGSDAAAGSKGHGQCSICGKQDTEVYGHLQVPNFKFYTLDKVGSISGGFDESNAWRNFPVCRECCERVDFSGEWIKKELSFKFYGFNYLLLPSPLQPAPSESFQTLRRLVDAKVDNVYSRRLTEAEDELFDAIAAESNRLQIDLLFYQPDPQSFRPALYVSGLVPTRFRDLFEAKEKVDAHAWLQAPGHKAFIEGSFTFKSLREIFPAKAGGSSFDDDFLAVTRAALEQRNFSTTRLLSVGMRIVQQLCIDGKPWTYRLADLLRGLLFFEFLTDPQPSNTTTMSLPDYGTSPQAERVRAFFESAPNRLKNDPAAQAVSLLGASCGRIESIQSHLSGAMPFSGKLKGFRLNQPDIVRLFVDAKEKSRAYGPEQERKVAGLLECVAAALKAAPDQWPLSPDEVSYFFALGHALRSRLADPAKDEETVDDPTPTP